MARTMLRAILTPEGVKRGRLRETAAKRAMMKLMMMSLMRYVDCGCTRYSWDQADAALGVYHVDDAPEPQHRSQDTGLQRGRGPMGGLSCHIATSACPA